jgi:cobalt-precorrin 5A hydrolase
MAVIGIGTTSRVTVEDVLAIIARAKEKLALLEKNTSMVRDGPLGLLTMRPGQAFPLPAAEGQGEGFSPYGGTAPHPVLLPMGEGTLAAAALSVGLAGKVCLEIDTPSLHVLASLDRPPINGVLSEAASRASLHAIFLPLGTLKAVASLCVTHSEKSMKVYGIPSVAEAAALAAAGPGARLLISRFSGRNTTASIAA